MSKPVYDSMPADEFVRKYGKPYDATADDYDRSAFLADIKEGKNDPIYNAHSYHTKVPPRAIIPYILHFTEPGDIILDPFCGSGMIGMAAMFCEKPPRDLLALVQGMNPDRKIKPGARRAILNDLSPAACHIAYNYCTPVDVDELKKEFERIKAAVKDEFDWLYGTEHYEPAVNLYDPQKPEVAARFKNPPASKAKDQHPKELFKGELIDRTWELISREEVERRMGPEALAKSPLPKEVKQFICIPATIQYTVWSDVHRCEGMVKVNVPGRKATRKAPRGCGKEIVLWDVAVDSKSRKVRGSFHCPQCNQEWKKTQVQRVGAIPVSLAYDFDGFSRTRTGVKWGTVRSVRALSKLDVQHCKEIGEGTVSCPVPQIPWDCTREMWRGGHRKAGIESLADFYTPRNLRAFARLWRLFSAVSAPRTKAWGRFALTAVCNRASKLNRLRPSGAGDPLTGTLYVSSFIREENVWELFCRKVKSLFRCRPVLRNCVAVVRGPAQDITGLDSETIDFVFTDPPFGSNIFYGDCSFLWEGWLGELTNLRREAVWNKSRKPHEGGKTLDEYGELMAQSFREIYRVLKPDRWATIEFNNSDGQVFEAIKKAARDAGFEIANMLFLDKDQKSFKQVKGAKGEENVVGHDVLFNLYKPGPVKRSTARAVVNGEFEHLVVDTVRDHLRGLPERIKKDAGTYGDEHRTTPFLNTMLMNSLIPQGVSVDRLNLPFIDTICSRYFRKIDNRWYLPDEAVGNGHEDGLRLPPSDIEIADEVSAIEWLRQLLTGEPMMLGDIKLLWMRATVQLTDDLSTQLERILRQNFWLDRTTNKWREPTAEERERMDTTERDRVRHDAERLLAGTIKESPSDAELCQWIGTLYDAAKAIEEEVAMVSDYAGDETPDEALDIYRQITSLFQRVLSERVEPKDYATASRQARMASLRVQHAEEAKQPPPKPPTLFDP